LLGTLNDWWFIRKPNEDYEQCLGRCFFKARDRQLGIWFGIGGTEQLSHNLLWGKRVPKELVLQNQKIDTWWLVKKMQKYQKSKPLTYAYLKKVFGHQSPARFWGTRIGSAVMTFAMFGTCLAGEEIICTNRCLQ